MYPKAVAQMPRADVSEAFQRRGWIKGAGGDLYFDGQGGREHPHLHLRINSQPVVRVGRDIRLAVHLLAWSDGRQGQQGGGGRAFIHNGAVQINPWQRYLQSLGMNRAMGEEFAYIMDYFTNG